MGVKIISLHISEKKLQISLQNFQKTQNKDCQRYLTFDDCESSKIFMKILKRYLKIFSLLITTKKQLRRI